MALYLFPCPQLTGYAEPNFTFKKPFESGLDIFRQVSSGISGLPSGMPALLSIQPSATVDQRSQSASSVPSARHRLSAGCSIGSGPRILP
eukprot:5706088-Amphidinium_carterae.1